MHQNLQISHLLHGQQPLRLAVVGEQFRPVTLVDSVAIHFLAFDKADQALRRFAYLDYDDVLESLILDNNLVTEFLQ
jgi:hypothetical protein